MVWETHEVRGEMSRLWFISLHLLPPLLPTKVENASGHAPPTYTAHKTRHPPMTPMLTPPSTLALVPARRNVGSNATAAQPHANLAEPAPRVDIDGQHEHEHYHKPQQ